METLKLSPWHLEALDAMLTDWICFREEIVPFDAATRYPGGGRELLACPTAPRHYPKIGSIYRRYFFKRDL